MKALAAVLGIVGSWTAPGFAQEANPPVPPAKSPLLGEGVLQQVRRPLEQIFQFKIAGATLKADRQSWGTAVKEADKAAVRGPRGSEHPIEAIFGKIQAAAGASSTSMTTGRHREISFSGNKMNGNLYLRGDTLRLSLEEAQAPQRTLEYRDDGQGSFRLQVMHPDGDLILMSQGRKGAFAVVALLGNQSFSGKGESFVAFYRQHRQEMDTLVLPALASLGIQPVLSPNTPRVRQAVLALVLWTPETLEEGKRLLADLDDDKIVVREKASRLLKERFEVHKDLIQEKLRDKASPLEVQKRLQQILDGQADSARANQIVTALNLTQDAAYVVSLLDHAAPDQISPIIHHLEQITGEKHGSDPAAWKEWARKGRK
jgi:hypothetical protein